jgi:hypothetical protein
MRSVLFTLSLAGCCLFSNVVAANFPCDKTFYCHAEQIHLVQPNGEILNFEPENLTLRVEADKLSIPPRQSILGDGTTQLQIKKEFFRCGGGQAPFNKYKLRAVKEFGLGPETVVEISDGKFRSVNMRPYFYGEGILVVHGTCDYFD